MCSELYFGEATAKRLGIDAEHGDGMQDRARLALLRLRLVGKRYSVLAGYCSRICGTAFG